VIGFAQHTLIAGMTRSGKSTLANYLFSEYRVRRVLVDSKAEWAVRGVPVHTLTARELDGARRQVDAIDWTLPIVHVRHSWLGQPGAKEQLEALFARISSLPGPLKTTLHEAYAVSSSDWAPDGLIAEAVAGNGRGHGLDVCTQRPVNIAVPLRTEATHVFIFPPLDDDDLIAARKGVPFLTINKARELSAQLPPYSYIWADRGTRRVDVGAPLPDYLQHETAQLITGRAA